MSDTGRVYTLSDPRTEEVKYVGATRNPKQRYQQHLYGESNKDVQEWIAELESNGHKPEMSLIRVAPIDELAEREQEIITRLANEWDLLNRQDHSGYSSRGDGEKSGMVNIPIEDGTRDVLRRYKAEEGDTYDDAIKRLLENDGWDVDD